MRVRRGIGRAELAALVCRTLLAIDDEPVLVGGSVVSLYTDGRWVSDDLDFVTWRRERQYRPLFEALGFHKRGSFWEHPRTELLVQFVNPPVMVGNKHVREPARMRTRSGSFALLSPLDCVLDRFAWYLDRGDAQTLEQAANVAAATEVSLDEVGGWLDAQSWPAARRRTALDELRRKVNMRRE